MSSSKALPSQLVIAAGTYDGVLAGWELTHKKQWKKGKRSSSSSSSEGSSSLELTFATPVHDGSLRCLSLASSTEIGKPGSLLSCGYDEMLRTHDWHKHKTSIGEVRTPSDLGTPTASSFAPPPSSTSTLPSTHCVVGFSNGKIVLYKKRDWSVQHVLGGHEGGVGSLAVHPTGKMALSGGQTDGKLKLWDLTKGRLAYVVKIPPRTTNRQTGKSMFDPVCSLVWSKEGNAYAFCHGSHLTVRDVASGKELLDVDLPSRANQVTLMTSSDATSPYYGNLFVAVACNDGSLPVLAVQNVDADGDEEDEDMTRRAILAIEPVDSPVAGEERFKCIESICDFFVVTANSAGVVSVMNLEGAVRMIMDPNQASEDEDEEDKSENESDDYDNDDDDAEELAVDILQSTRLGSGARITSMAVWCNETVTAEDEDEDIERPGDDESEEEGIEDVEEKSEKGKGTKRKVKEIEVNADAIEKARSLVSQAKKLKKKKEKKKKKKNKINESTSITFSK